MSISWGDDLSKAEVENIARCAIAALEKRIGELEAVIAWANNSLYGSHGLFLSLDGGPANPHHLDTAIERLKADARKAESALTAERQRRESAEKVALPLSQGWQSYGGTEREHKAGLLRGTLAIWDFENAAKHFSRYAHSDDSEG